MAGFAIFIGLSLVITWFAARRTRSTEHFYAAGRSITAFQNGLALAGDYMSAASFLGIAGPGRALRVRRPDLLDRLPGRLARRRLPDRGAAAQSRQVHVQRRRRVPPAAGAGARRRGRRQPRGGRVLPDRADGGRRQPDPAAVRPRLRNRRGDRRRGDARLRALRRHDRHHVGADREGGAAADRRLHAGDDGAGEVLVQSARAVRRRRAAIRRRRARARTLRVGSGRRHLARAWR